MTHLVRARAYLNSATQFCIVPASTLAYAELRFRGAASVVSDAPFAVKTTEV